MSVPSITKNSQYLTFTMDGELFALDIAKVMEVLDYTRITKLLIMPKFILGVINLRGRLVPVIDMRNKFCMAGIKNTVNTCIVIVEVSLESKNVILGALIDSVQEVFDLEPEEIELLPQIGMKLKTEFIKSIGEKEEKFIIILDIDRVFSTDDLIISEESNKKEE